MNEDGCREEWASQFSCPVHGQRIYDTVLTTKCCGEVLENGQFCNEILIRGEVQYHQHEKTADGPRCPTGECNAPLTEV